MPADRILARTVSAAARRWSGDEDMRGSQAFGGGRKASQAGGSGPVAADSYNMIGSVFEQRLFHAHNGLQHRDPTFNRREP
jgi:hypothetical protein